MIPVLSFDRERLEQAAGRGYTLATDIADYLVLRGVPFRDAHAAVSELVRYANAAGKQIAELSLDEYRSFSPAFGEDVLGIDVRSSIAARDVPGGTASVRVAEALAEARERLAGS